MAADEYDVIVIGAGAAGEASGSLGAELGGRIAVVERDLIGGECSFWACMPSKSLLDSASRRAIGADYPWERAAARRDWMISREDVDYPGDTSHADALEKAGAEVVRGQARIVGRGKVEVRANGSTPRILEGKNLIVSTGSTPFIPHVDGLAEAGYWTSRDATSLRTLPTSIVILGGGPVGVEMAQVFLRFGVKTHLVESNERLLARDHARSSEVLREALEDEGADLHLGVRAQSVRTGGRGRIVTLSDGSEIDAAEVLVAVGRRARDLRDIGIEEAGVGVDERGLAKPDEQMRVGRGVFVAGDAAGGLQFTHLADYEGRIAVRAALGQEVKADLNAVPKATYTDPETGAVGLTIDEARDRGIDAFEVTQDFATTARGFTIEGSKGHVTVVIDRERAQLIGAFAACPLASEFIHEAVVGVKFGIPVRRLADTIHSFPTGARVLGNLMADAAKRLE